MVSYSLAHKDISEIITAYQSGLPQWKVGQMFGLSQSSISGIVRQAGLGKPSRRRRVTSKRRDGLAHTELNTEWEVEPYRILHDGVRQLMALKPWPRLRLTAGRPLLMLVFCYGSLRQGFGNHRLVEDSIYCGLATTDPEFTLLHLGGFPGVVRQGSDRILGELYDVDESTQLYLDQLEGHPDFYRREQIVVENALGQKFEAWIYVLPDIWLTDNTYPIIKSGDWADVRRQLKEVV